MSVKKRSRKGKGSFAVYKNENRVAKNRAAKLARHVAANPTDAPAVKAAKAKRGNLRKTPVHANSTRSVPKLRDASGKVLPWPAFVPTDANGRAVDWPWDLYEFTELKRGKNASKQPSSKAQ